MYLWFSPSLCKFLTCDFIWFVRIPLHTYKSCYSFTKISSIQMSQKKNILTLKGQWVNLVACRVRIALYIAVLTRECQIICRLKQHVSHCGIQKFNTALLFMCMVWRPLWQFFVEFDIKLVFQNFNIFAQIEPATNNG